MTEVSNKKMLKIEIRVMQSWAAGFIFLIITSVMLGESEINLEELAAVTLLLIFVSLILQVIRRKMKEPISISAQALIDAE